MLGYLIIKNELVAMVFFGDEKSSGSAGTFWYTHFGKSPSQLLVMEMCIVKLPVLRPKKKHHPKTNQKNPAKKPNNPAAFFF